MEEKVNLNDLRETDPASYAIVEQWVDYQRDRDRQELYERMLEHRGYILRRHERGVDVLRI